MDTSLVNIRHLLEANIWAILGVCLLVYLVASVRLLVSGISFLNPAKLTKFPEEMPIPSDVWFGYGISTFVACASITLSILLQGVSVLSVIVALTADAIAVGVAYASILAPIRAWRVTIRRMHGLETDKSEGKRPG